MGAGAETAAGEWERDIDGAEGRPVEDSSSSGGNRDMDGADGRPVGDSSSSGGNRDMDGADGRPGVEVRFAGVARGDCGGTSGRMWME